MTKSLDVDFESNILVIYITVILSLSFLLIRKKEKCAYVLKTSRTT